MKEGQGVKLTKAQAEWETLDAEGRPVDHPDYEPPCDVSGDCEPYDSERNETEAMCRYCGGWRRKDYPWPGNWGVPE
jgi:hypothetical protein